MRASHSRSFGTSAAALLLTARLAARLRGVGLLAAAVVRVARFAVARVGVARFAVARVAVARVAVARVAVARIGVARFAAAWLAVALLAACRDEAPAAPPVERLARTLDFARVLATLPKPAPPRNEIHGTWVTSDTRDAVRGTWGRPLAFPAAVSGRAEVLAAFAVELGEARAAGGVEAAGARVAAELRLVTGGGDVRLARAEAALSAASEAWTELCGRAADLAPGARIEVAFDWLGPGEPPAESAPLAVVPRVLAPRGERRNLLVISVDTLRADHLGFHGYARDTSPRLDAFVARGAVFERAISTSPWTLPAYGTLFTGLEPAHHRAGISARREAAFGTDRDAEGGDYQSLDPRARTLAQSLREAGYATAAFASNPFLDPGSGIDRGFDAFAQYLNRAGAGVELCERWIASRGEAPWFAFLHLMDPHAPYSPPPPYDTRFAARALRDLPGGHPSIDSLRAAEPDAALRELVVGAYDGEIAYTDARIGDLLDALERAGQLARTLVVIHSDHGEEFWEHGGFEHGHALNEESLHVPLAFVAPGLVQPGLRVEPRTSTVHACATILDLLGVPVPPDLDGASLAPFLRVGATSAPFAPRPCISESLLYGPREEKSWSFGPEKLVTDGAGRTRLYDLSADAHETHDLAGQRAERAADLRGLLLGRARAAAARAGTAAPAAFNATRRAEIEGLGYPGGY